MTIRRRSGLLFLAAALSLLCVYVFFHGGNIQALQSLSRGAHRNIDLCYLDQKQAVSPQYTQSTLSASLPAGHPFVKHNSDALTPASERPLITYVYYETDFSRVNLQFFLAHALHDAADFIFILNGETDAEKLIFNDPYAEVPKDIRHLFPHPTLDNVFVRKRPNTCFDLGAHAEVLQSALGNGTGWLGVNGPIHGPIHKDKNGVAQLLRHHYTRFIMLNGSIRGPFLPAWSRSCWSDIYLNRLTQRIKLVGMSYNCHFGNGHVQSMIWATDRAGLDLMLTKEGMGECFEEIGKAMAAEVRMTKLLRDNDYEVDAFLSNYHSMDKEARYARMRARMQAGQNLAKRGEVEPAAPPTAGTGGTSTDTPETPQGHRPDLENPDACSDLMLAWAEHLQKTADLSDEDKNEIFGGLYRELYSACKETSSAAGDIDAEKLASWISTHGSAIAGDGDEQDSDEDDVAEDDIASLIRALVSAIAGDGNDTSTGISAAGVEGRDTDVKKDLSKVLERSRTVPEWKKEEMWKKMRKEIMAGHGKVKRQADQMGDVTAAAKPEATAPGQRKYEYEIRPTKEEEDAMIKAYHLRENSEAEQWFPYKGERYPLFPKGKRSAPVEEEKTPTGEGKERRFEPLPPQPESEETKSLHFTPDDSHHPYADISAQTQNYSQKLLTDTLDEPGYFWRECRDEDWLGRGSYADSFVHPFENLFMKSHRGIAESLLGNLTMWKDGEGRGSWNVCH